MKSSLLLSMLLLLPCSMSLAQPNPPGPFTLTGENGGENDTFGWSVAPAGDVNGDGVPDLIVGAPTHDGVAGFAGKAYLFYGPITEDRSAANADATIRAQTFGDNLGVSVAAAGDVNNDGFDDLIIGARGNDTPGIQAGRAYLFLGPLSGNLTDAQAHATFSGVAFEELGISVASAGDLNDDGFSDLVLGAHRFSASGLGRAYVFFGPISGHHASASADAIITGEFASDDLGTSVASAGDVNGDGIDDVIVGAPHTPIQVADPGRAYIFFGPISGSMSAAAADIILHGETDNDQFGSSVASAGDVNGDGLGDVLVGATQIFNNGPGKAYLYFGPVDESPPVPDAIFTGEQSLDNFGQSVASAGDVNGDGYDDIIVGALNNSDRAGRAYVFAGQPVMGPIPAASANLIITGEAPDDHFGQSVASAGDLDGNGRPDLFVGAPQFNDGDPGKAHIYLNEILVGVFENPRSAIGPLRITPNVPNPFRNSTAIHYDVPNEGRARLTIYDVRGRVVRSLVDGQKPAGTNIAVWDGREDSGHLSPSGIYFCRLEADGLTVARRVVLLR